MISFDYAVQRVLDSINVIYTDKKTAETIIKDSVVKNFQSLNFEKLPDFFINLVVLEKMKEIFEDERESKVALQRNFTLKEINFFRKNGIRIFTGDLEIFNENHILADFEDKVYILDYDVKNSSIFINSFQFSFEENILPSYVS
ncbi:MAG: hypothetical protein JW924_10320 [Fusobacteriaceae bacterium]|nr:hypothetical protein [Fusobacteriaceae bacterium]